MGRSPQVAPDLYRYITDRIQEDNKLATEKRTQKEERHNAAVAAAAIKKNGKDDKG